MTANKVLEIIWSNFDSRFIHCSASGLFGDERG